MLLSTISQEQPLKNAQLRGAVGGVDWLGLGTAPGLPVRRRHSSAKMLPSVKVVLQVWHVGDWEACYLGRLHGLHNIAAGIIIHFWVQSS